MSTLTVRRLPEEVRRALRAEAAQEGVSAEEKARRILACHVLPEARGGLGRDLGALVDDLGVAGDGFVPPRLSRDVEPASLS
jgi:plasmid stability protein